MPILVYLCIHSFLYAICKAEEKQANEYGIFGSVEETPQGESSSSELIPKDEIRIRNGLTGQQQNQI